MNLAGLNETEYLSNKASEAGVYDMVPVVGKNEVLEYMDKEVHSIFYDEKASRELIFVYFADQTEAHIHKDATFNLCVTNVPNMTAMQDL